MKFRAILRLAEGPAQIRPVVVLTVHAKEQDQHHRDEMDGSAKSF